jgi:iron(II)-dependent oxidoreductase
VTDRLADWIREARARTLKLVDDLSDEELMGPRLAIVNPLRWEIGHVAWFQEHWILRHHLGEQPMIAAGDSLYDSSAIPHDTRWDLPLPTRAETISYLEHTRDRVLERLSQLEEGRGRYFALLATFHEDMHDEAFFYTRQTLGYRAPQIEARKLAAAGPLPGDASVPGGEIQLGSPRGQEFIFDNEKWAHRVAVAPFRIARAPVTQAELAEFVRAGGYRDERLWSEAGWQWRCKADARHPLYWRPAGDGFERRDYDRWVPLEPHRPAIHVGYYEAEAFCKFAGRRLPTEVEWEAAATGATQGPARRFPWGDSPEAAERCNLDGLALGCADVAAFPDGDSACGCRQLIGNVWEWTSSDFVPYPGFSADPYRDYSQPWFGSHKVLRGGAWTTTSRMIRPAYRNFYMPDRRDVWAGFRTCAA